jgi:glycosyltransferase involved in cell wall biosynthesis
MNILVTLDFPPEVGGIQRYLHDIVTHTYTQSDIVYTGVRRKPLRSTPSCYPCSVRYTSFPFSFLNKKLSLLSIAILLFPTCLKHHSSAILYAGNIYPGILTWILSHVTGIRYRIYTYGSELLVLKRGRTLKRILWKRILKSADEVYYISGATKSILRAILPADKCIYHPPKISLPENAAPLPHSRKACLELLSVGRLVPHKGHLFLLKAVAALPESLSWHLTIAGNGPLLQRTKRNVSQLHLTDHVSFGTSIIDSELKTLYKRADLFIFPSIETEHAVEGFGIVLLEAMAHSTAIIASACGGITDVFKQCGDCAILVEPGNIQKLQQAIIMLADDHHLRDRLSRNAFHFLKEHYAW